MKKKSFLKETALNTVVIFISYLLAVVIRYRILRSEPGIDALSIPYLLVAFIYSLLISITFDKDEFPRWRTHSSGMNSVFKMLSQNAIGCLLLLAAFYVVGIVNFSRWALFLFWGISSASLLIKREVVYARIARRREAGKDVKKVLLIGDGLLAKDYIRSLSGNPQFGIMLGGYLGTNGKLATDTKVIFDLENYPEPIIKWLGEYSNERLEVCIEEEKIERIVIADDAITDEKATEIVKTAKKFGLKTLLSVPCDKLINPLSTIHDLGDAKQIELSESVHNRNIYPTGIVITIALLMLIFITGKFEMQTMNTMNNFDGYRCIIFALLSFFIYLSWGDVSVGVGEAVKRTAIVWVIMMAGIVLYEIAYGDKIMQGIRLDALITSGLLGICFVISMIFKSFEQLNYIFMD